MTNRRERRAQVREKNETIPFAQPTRGTPTHKTLVDLASERAAVLNNGSPPSSSKNPSITTTTLNPDGTLSSPETLSQSTPASGSGQDDRGGVAEADEPPTPLWLDILLYTTSLTLLHFTLTVLVHHQYSTQPPNLASLFYGSTIYPVTPLLLAILVSILHPLAVTNNVPVQILFAITNVVAGCWLVRASNEDAYLEVMKKAPPLGVIWVWAVVELRWEVALAGLGVVGGYAWWCGYGFT